MVCVKRITVFIICTLLVGCSYSDQNTGRCQNYYAFKNMQQQVFKSTADFALLFPKSKQEVEQYSCWVIDYAREQLQTFLKQEESKQTFASTILALDKISSRFAQVLKAIHVLASLASDDSIRIACKKAEQDLSKEYVDLFQTREVYQVFLNYVNAHRDKEILSTEEEYLLDEYMKDFKREGFHLDDERFAQVKELKKEISANALSYYQNTSQDESTITVEESGLAGLKDEFIAGLEKTEGGNYRLGCDYPTLLEVLGHCAVTETRKKLSRCFNNRAYPANYEVLTTLVNKRNELANLLGYASFADFNIEPTMAESVSRVESFLAELIEKARDKENQEFTDLIKELPDGIQLTNEGKMYPWDRGYVTKLYKKKKYDFDELEVAQYFPLEKVMQGVFDVYQEFFSLRFTLIEPAWKWHEDVMMIQVNDKASDEVRGYIYLDLYPRKNKLAHPCCMGIAPTFWDTDAKTGNRYRRLSLSCVNASFPKATKDKPSLLKFNDARTFLHEFGHAIHNLLGTTIAPSVAGFAVKLDFIEVPSQMLEEWIYVPDVLRLMSGHYKTGEPLPDHLIKTIVDLKSFDRGEFIVRQAAHALFSLELYKHGADKEFDTLSENIYTSCLKNMVFDAGHNHHPASFIHLVGYGARYYSYLWSKVLSLDLFEQLKKEGVLDPQVGKRLVTQVLGHGGGVHPEHLLESFLGRPSNMNAFCKDMGLSA